jgi:TonB family protein
VRHPIEIKMRRLVLLLALTAAAPASAQQTQADSARVYELTEVEVLPRPQNAAEFMTALREGYPAHLQASRTEGTVQVAFVVGPDGVPQSARVAESTEAGFDSVTIAAVGVLRFTPATVAGRAVSVRVVQPVQWRLPAPDPAEKVAESAVSAQAVDGVSELAEVEEFPSLLNRADFRRALDRMYPLGRDEVPVGATVQVRFRVSEDGTVSVPAVTRSSDVRFNDATMRAVQVLRFRPARVNGRPVKVWVEQPIAWSPPSRPWREAAASGNAQDGYELSEVEELPRPVNGSVFAQALAREYPPHLRDAGLSGSVQVRFLVDVDGSTSQYAVTHSTNTAFNQPTLRALQVLRFRPAKVNGRPVKAWVEQPVTWSVSSTTAMPPLYQPGRGRMNPPTNPCNVTDC